MNGNMCLSSNKKEIIDVVGFYDSVGVCKNVG